MKVITFGTILLVALWRVDSSGDNEKYVFPEMTLFPTMPQNPDNPVTVEGVRLGRYLFYDKILSRDYTVSCASCHQQEYAFSGGPVRFSTGIDSNQMTRNTPPLFNLAYYDALFWDGRARSIEEQVFVPVRSHDEMDLDWLEAVDRIRNNPFYRNQFEQVFGDRTIDSVLIAKAIAQFERTLLSYRSKFDEVLAGRAYLSEDEREGFVIINEQDRGDCLHCHTTDANPVGTNGTFSNNGLDSVSDSNNYADPGLGATTGKKEDVGKFKIPSLRNVAVTGPYMHDGRFETLEEVLEFYSNGVNNSVNIDNKMHYAHQHGVHLSCEEQAQVIAFLKTLTDSVFISDPAYSDPFKD